MFPLEAELEQRMLKCEDTKNKFFFIAFLTTIMFLFATSPLGKNLFYLFATVTCFYLGRVVLSTLAVETVKKMINNRRSVNPGISDDTPFGGDDEV